MRVVLWLEATTQLMSLTNFVVRLRNCAPVNVCHQMTFPTDWSVTNRICETSPGPMLTRWTMLPMT
jgi:hypothetical protein